MNMSTPDLQTRIQHFRRTHAPKHIHYKSVDWEYLFSGEGENVILLLHGGLRIAETAFAYIELFEGDYRVIAPTYPPLSNIDELTDGLAGLLDAEGLDRVLVLTQSYGGMVGQVFAQRFPGRVRKLALGGTGPLGGNPIQEFVLKIMLILAPRLSERRLKAIYRWGIDRVLALPEGDKLSWEAYLDEIFNQRLTGEHVLSHFRTSADTLEKYAFGRIGSSCYQGPVLIISGGNDPVVSQADREALERFYPQAKCVIISGAGHTLAMAAPGDYHAAVNSFFEAP
jgi:pimeloyl-ACP methyl ester carboxylesterase